MQQKTCSKCDRTLPVSDFSSNKTRRDGLQDRCKACNRAYAEANKERIRARKRARYAENADEQRARSLAYRAANLDRVRAYDRERTSKRREWKMAYDRARYAANKEQDNERSRLYRLANHDRLRTAAHTKYAMNPEAVKRRVRAWIVAHPVEARAQSQRRRGRERSAEGTHTAADLQAQYERQRSRCYWCGQTIDSEYHVDHIVPLSKGGSNWPENLVIACPQCNQSKGDKLPHEWPKSGRLL